MRQVVDRADRRVWTYGQIANDHLLPTPTPACRAIACSLAVSPTKVEFDVESAAVGAWSSVCCRWLPKVLAGDHSSGPPSVTGYEPLLGEVTCRPAQAATTTTA